MTRLSVEVIEARRGRVTFLLSQGLSMRAVAGEMGLRVAALRAFIARHMGGLDGLADLRRDALVQAIQSCLDLAMSVDEIARKLRISRDKVRHYRRVCRLSGPRDGLPLVAAARAARARGRTISGCAGALGLTPMSLAARLDALAPDLIDAWRLDQAAAMAGKGRDVWAVASAVCLPQRSLRQMVEAAGRVDLLRALWPRAVARRPRSASASGSVLATPPVVVVPPPPPPRRAGSVIPGPVLTLIWGHLAALPPAPVWDGGGDLALARAMARQADLAPVARAVGVSVEDLRNRWLVICPNRTLPMAAEAVLRALEAGVRSALRGAA